LTALALERASACPEAVAGQYPGPRLAGQWGTATLRTRHRLYDLFAALFTLVANFVGPFSEDKTRTFISLRQPVQFGAWSRKWGAWALWELSQGSQSTWHDAADFGFSLISAIGNKIVVVARNDHPRFRRTSALGIGGAKAFKSREAPSRSRLLIIVLLTHCN
jgi:hypothetical protein